MLLLLNSRAQRKHIAERQRLQLEAQIQTGSWRSRSLKRYLHDIQQRELAARSRNTAIMKKLSEHEARRHTQKTNELVTKSESSLNAKKVRFATIHFTHVHVCETCCCILMIPMILCCVLCARLLRNLQSNGNLHRGASSKSNETVKHYKKKPADYAITETCQIKFAAPVNESRCCAWKC